MDQLRLTTSNCNSEVKNCSPANLRNTSPLSGKDDCEAPLKEKKKVGPSKLDSNVLKCFTNDENLESLRDNTK
jgi:hypothetical protein